MECIPTIQSVMMGESRSIAYVAEHLNPQQAQQVFEAILNCQGIVYVSGCGTSAAAGKKISHTLCCVKRPAVFLEPSDALHGGLGVVRKEDLVLLLSKGGQTQEVIAMMPALKEAGCLTVAVTDWADTPLAKQAALLLQLPVDKEPDPFNMLATASTVAMIAFFDGVCIAYMQQTGFTQKEFAVIHPEGAVGRRLSVGEG